MARFLIVDAHSAIFAWPEMRAMHLRRTGLARHALVKALTEYQDFSGIRVVAVFDGQGAKIEDATEPGGIQVFYSARGQSADEVIERLVATYAHEHQITVATNDSLEQQTASTFGATCISAETLHSMMEQSQADFTRELKRRKRTLGS